MTSEKQVAANKENAKNSSGPRTQEGKARSSGNAVKHGLTAKDRVVLADESREQFEAMRLLLLEEMQMGSALEKLLIEEIAASAWRLRRIARIEKEMMDHDLRAVAAETDGAGEAVTLGARLAGVRASAPAGRLHKLRILLIRAIRPIRGTRLPSEELSDGGQVRGQRRSRS